MQFIMQHIDIIMGNTASAVLAHPSPSSTHSLTADTGEETPEMSSWPGGATLAKMGLGRCIAKGYGDQISFQTSRG